MVKSKNPESHKTVVHVCVHACMRECVRACVRLSLKSGRSTGWTYWSHDDETLLSDFFTSI